MILAEQGKKTTKMITRKIDQHTVTPSDYVLHLKLTPAQSLEFDRYYE